MEGEKGAEDATAGNITEAIVAESAAGRRCQFGDYSARLMAHYHLRQHSALSNLNPDDLIFEQSTPNSCSSQSRLAPSSDGTRVGL